MRVSFNRSPVVAQCAEQGVQPGDAGEPLGVPDDVDGAGVAAAGHDDQSLAAHVHDEGLVSRVPRWSRPLAEEEGGDR